MKKSILLILGLIIVFAFTGCATTPDTETDKSPEQVLLSETDSVGSPEPAISADEAPKKGLDALISSVTDWPENKDNPPVEMSIAEDSAMWDTFVDMVNGGRIPDDLERFLTEWYRMFGWTPDFYAGCHNYYFQKVFYMIENQVSEQDISIIFPVLENCFNITYHGFMQYPDRLDLWCGYVHASNMVGSYEEAAECCLWILNRLEYNDNKWYWTYNNPFYWDDEAARESEFIGIMHDYISEFLNEKALDCALPVSSRLVECFPDNAVVLNDMALCFIYNADLESALPYLEHAVEINPTDVIVMANLAYVYADLGEYEASLELANRLIQSGDPDSVTRGIELCAELNKLINPDK